MRVRLSFANAYSGTLHLYAVDWDAIGGAENITVDDGSGPRRSAISAFVDGAWVHAPISVGAGGSVVITADKTAGTSAVLAGLFLGGAGATSGISLAKSANPTTYSAVGQTITYGYTITNTGNVSLGSSQFTVSDDHIGSPLGTAFKLRARRSRSPQRDGRLTKTYTISPGRPQRRLGHQQGYRVGSRADLEPGDRHRHRGGDLRHQPRQERQPDDVQRRRPDHHLQLHGDQHRQREPRAPFTVCDDKATRPTLPSRARRFSTRASRSPAPPATRSPRPTSTPARSPTRPRRTVPRRHRPRTRTPRR